MKKNAVDALKDFCSLQSELCSALKKQFPRILDEDVWIELPKHGSVSIGSNGYWEFGRHGNGVMFSKEPEKIAIDVPSDIFRSAFSFDRWRLVTYFESAQIDLLELSGEFYRSDDDGVGALLLALERESLIERMHGRIGAYELAL